MNLMDFQRLNYFSVTNRIDLPFFSIMLWWLLSWKDGRQAGINFSIQFLNTERFNIVDEKWRRVSLRLWSQYQKRLINKLTVSKEIMHLTRVDINPTTPTVSSILRNIWVCVISDRDNISFCSNCVINIIVRLAEFTTTARTR